MMLSIETWIIMDWCALIVLLVTISIGQMYFSWQSYKHNIEIINMYLHQYDDLWYKSKHKRR